MLRAWAEVILGTVPAKPMVEKDSGPHAPELSALAIGYLPFYFEQVHGRERLEQVWRTLEPPFSLDSLGSPEKFVSLHFYERMLDALTLDSGDPDFLHKAARFSKTQWKPHFKRSNRWYEKAIEALAKQNRVGQYSVERRGKGEVVVKYVSSIEERSPNTCIARGALWEAMAAEVGLSAEAEELECLHRGDGSCSYLIRWIPRARTWRRYVGAAAGAGLALGLFHLRPAAADAAFPLAGFFLGGWWDVHRRQTADDRRNRTQTGGLRKSMEQLHRQYEEAQKAKLEIEKTNAVLEQRVERRTRDLAQAVAAQKAALQRFQQSEERLSITLNSISDGVVATDKEARIVRMNPAAEQLSGWAFQEALGQLFHGVFRTLPEGAPEENLAARVLREEPGAGGGGPKTLVDKQGKERIVAARAAPIRDSTGAVVGAVVVFRDLTEEKALEQRVLLSERMASIGTMASGVAHEINNPLAYVVGNLSYVANSLDSLSGPPELLKDVRDAVADAQDGADRVRIVVHDMKAFARPEEDEVEEVDLRLVLNSALSMAAFEIRHRARLNKVFGETPLVLANAAKLGQVFLNILVNAAQALPEGKANHNIIGVRTYTDAHGRAVVEISDTGPGIPETLRQRIFDPFFTTKAVGEGSGLGLSVSHAIVTSLGGEISLDSMVGQGSTFTVTLPAAAPRPKAAKDKAEAPLPTPAVSGLSILVVDDEEMVTTSVRRCLEPVHRVTVETSPEKALGRLLSGQSYDVIFTDLMMPQMSGMDFYRELQKRKPSVLSKLVFMTGGAFTASARNFLKTVSNRCVDKPFSSEALLKIIAEMVMTRDA